MKAGLFHLRSAGIVLFAFFTFVIVGTLHSDAADRAVEMREGSVSIEGKTIYYRTGGEGPFLLLLHGFTLSGRVWQPYVNEFGAEYTLVIPDLPGHGQSQPLARFSLDESARLLHKLLDTLNVDHCQAIGHSAGGVTLLHMARQIPERLESIVLLGVAHRFSEEGAQLLREDTFEKLSPELLAYYETLHSGGSEQIRLIFQQLNALPDNPEWDGHTSEFLAQISSPILLICGEDDPYFPPDVVSELMSQLNQGQLWSIPEQGHCPIFPELGGSVEVASKFPATVRQFWHSIQ